VPILKQSLFSIDIRELFVFQFADNTDLLRSAQISRKSGVLPIFSFTYLYENEVKKGRMRVGVTFIGGNLTFGPK
jgi:hypothetical protein